VSSALFFSYNMALGPPYRVIVDTNFINFSIQNKVRPLIFLFLGWFVSLAGSPVESQLYKVFSVLFTSHHLIGTTALFREF
jgi:hypothetical protein